MGFAEFKKAQSKQDKQAETKFIEEDTKTKSFKDSRFWLPTKDSKGNSKSIIRFLPQKDPTKTPYTKTYTHAFQNPETKRWLIEDCPWTIKVPCPICSYAQEEYQKGNRKPLKQTWYISNILVVKDENAPENEGKVFLYKFGKEIFKKIEAAVKGDPDDDIDPISVFNIMDGHNFRLTTSLKEIPNFNRPVNDYDKCRFEIQGEPICGGNEAEMEKVYNSIYDLDEFVDPKRFKSEDELKEKLIKFVSGGGSGKSVLDELREQQEKINAKKEEPSPKEKVSEDEVPFDISDGSESDKDDDDDFFDLLDDEDDDLFEDEVPF